VADFFELADFFDLTPSSIIQATVALSSPPGRLQYNKYLELYCPMLECLSVAVWKGEGGLGRFLHMYAVDRRKMYDRNATSETKLQCWNYPSIYL